MTYKIEYLTGFEKDIKKLQRKAVDAIFVKIKTISGNPRPVGYKKIRGYVDLYRVRVGDYRMVYRINDGKKLVCLVRVCHRSKVYEGLIG